jgi:pyruvate-ferredoxin/flavodoxin oxidoreductase
LLHVTCWRPFPSIEVVEALRHCKGIAVIERLDIPMMQSNPLLSEIKAAFADSVSGTPGYPELDRVPKFFSGSAGLGSRDVRAGDYIAIVENMVSQSPRY